ncbi:MAG: acetylglutamate kinase [Planctomycetota bacterium]|nr:acetylglutamate kinase [Planctomycetota bacterium]
MDEAIRKADTLIEAMSWIQQFRDKVTVIKLGGSVLEDTDALRHILLDVCFMQTVGLRTVIVHGAGARISRAMDAENIKPRFVQGRRYTDEKTLSIVEKVLARDTNIEIATTLEKLGGRAMTLNFESTNVLTGERLEIQGDNGHSLDLGFVGTVTEVDRLVIENLCYAGQVPIIPSMCLTPSGQKLNVNADSAATAVATSLGAEKLIMLSDVPGVMSDPADASTLIDTLTSVEARQLIGSGKIGSGMIPKVEGCLETLDQGVGKVHIVDGRIRHSLLLEMFTSKGIGTQFLA